MSHATPHHRPKKHHEEEHENHERWAVSYADMMTVLLALFIVLYAISVVDKTKFEQLRTSLAIGFGQEVTSVIEGSSGPLNGVESFQIAPNFTGVNGEATPQLSNPDVELSEQTQTFLAAAQEYQQLDDIKTQIEESLAAQGLGANVEFKIDERGLIIGMVGSDVFFSPDDAALTSVAQQVVDSLAVPLRQQTRQISVEGHADVVPSERYATNWELSGARATQVLRRFVESGGLSGAQISATAFGDARPIAQGTSAEALAENRRVDIVIESSATEQVRDLLPKISQALEEGLITVDELQSQMDQAAEQLAKDSENNQ